ncbi:MAG: hypothetical protein QNK23_15665 [Crocinitomicaceae bacterium]|nr:hypothetical protein [Crocinitomicaceae bacterium]
MGKEKIILKCQHFSYVVVFIIVFITLLSMLSILYYNLSQLYFIPVILFAVIAPVVSSKSYIVIEDGSIYFKKKISNNRISLKETKKLVLRYFSFTYVNDRQLSFLITKNKRIKITFDATDENKHKIEAIIRSINKNGGAVLFESDSKKGYYSDIKIKLGVESYVIRPNSL